MQLLDLPRDLLSLVAVQLETEHRCAWAEGVAGA